MTQVVAAVDVGGTRIKSALVSMQLEVLVERSLPTPRDVGPVIGAEVTAIIDRLGREARAAGLGIEVVGCGIVVPGIVDEAAQVARLAVNLGWHDLRVADAISEATGLACVLGHDVRAGLIAETRVGAAQGARDVLFVALGTGIAAAVLADGRLLTAGGWAGELGHVVVDPQGLACACGARGCLETVSSASAVARAYRTRTGAALDARAVADLVNGGDPPAVAVWSDAVLALAQGIVGAVALTGSELVVIGGGLARSGTTLLIPLRAAVAELLTFHRAPRIELAALGEFAGCVGAASLAWDAAPTSTNDRRNY